MVKEDKDPFAGMLEGKEREAYEAFGIALRKWTESNIDATGMDFSDALEAAAFVFSVALASYVSACVPMQSDLPIAKRCTVDIVNRTLDWCFDQVDLVPVARQESSRVH